MSMIWSARTGSLVIIILLAANLVISGFIALRMGAIFLGSFYQILGQERASVIVLNAQLQAAQQQIQQLQAQQQKKPGR